jgi:hypothetical protein
MVNCILILATAGWQAEKMYQQERMEDEIRSHVSMLFGGPNQELRRLTILNLAFIYYHLRGT